jgi:hypothetical protein
MPVNRVDLDPELASEPCRHTDGMQSGDSERAITNRYSGHGETPCGVSLWREVRVT